MRRFAPRGYWYLLTLVLAHLPVHSAWAQQFFGTSPVRHLSPGLCFVTLSYETHASLRAARIAVAIDAGACAPARPLCFVAQYSCTLKFNCLYLRDTSIRLGRTGFRLRRLCLPGLPCFWCSACLLLPCGHCRRGAPGA